MEVILSDDKVVNIESDFNERTIVFTVKKFEEIAMFYNLWNKKWIVVPIKFW